jgi:hypothetical protein
MEMKIKLVNSLLVVVVASLVFGSCTVFGKETEAKKTSLSKIEMKIPKDKSFAEQYGVVLQKLKENSPLKDSFESIKEYENRMTKNNFDTNLSFVEYFDIRLKYDPEERTLVYNKGKYENNLYDTPYVDASRKFSDCGTEKITNSTIISSFLKDIIEEVPSCFVLSEKSNLFTTRGFTKDLKYKRFGEYVATNGFGAKVTVEKYEGESIYLVSNNELDYQQLFSFKIKADTKEYAKANTKVKLKIIGEIINPQLIEQGVYYLKATFDKPTEVFILAYGAFIKIHSMAIVDSNGKEWIIGSQSE